MYSVQQSYTISAQEFEKAPLAIYKETPNPKEANEEKNSQQCSICGLIISNKWNFTLHMRVHNNDRRYKCDQCSSSFITSYDLKKHTLAHAGVKPRFKCQFCPKTYASRHSKYLHEDTHDKLKYKCKHCPDVFAKFADWKRHEKESHLNDKVFFNCSECNKKFTSSRFLETHEKNYHKKEEDGFKCEECGALFETSINLNIHRRSHVNKTIVISETDPLGYQNNKVKTIKKKKPVELFGIRIHECIICTRRYTSRGDMLAHMSLSHPKENKAIFKFPCSMCDKSFKCKPGLTQHLISHNGEKKFSCSLCDYKSKRSADLKVHMRKHTGEAPYACDKCDRRFQQVKSFQHHKKLHFGKIFKCDLCDASFYRSRELEWHKQKHSSGGFKCLECGKLLANPYSLKSHLRIGKCNNGKRSMKNGVKIEKKLGDHVLKIKTGVTKCYECFACGYFTLSSLDMIQHQTLHNISNNEIKTREEEALETDKGPNSCRPSRLMKMLKISAEKVNYKGIMSASKEREHVQPSLVFPPIEDTLKLSDNVLFNSNMCPTSDFVRLNEKIFSVNGKACLPIEELKHFDVESIVECIKFFSEKGY